jgi:uncharacterized protein (DUF2267 family)
VRYADVVRDVQSITALPTVLDADRATRATLQVLGRRLAACPTKQFAYRLPAPLASELDEHDDAEEFDLDTFYDLVAERERVPASVARQHARAVTAALRATMPEAGFAQIAAQLPDEYHDLLGSIADAGGTAAPDQEQEAHP